MNKRSEEIVKEGFLALKQRDNIEKTRHEMCWQVNPFSPKINSKSRKLSKKR